MPYTPAQDPESYRGRGRRGRGRGRGRRGRGPGDWYGQEDGRPAPVNTLDDEEEIEFVDYERAGNLTVSVSSHGERHIVHRNGSTPPPPPQLKNGWQYRDPEGNEHGPFHASQLVKWMEKGYFSGGLEVRQVIKGTPSYWSTLSACREILAREAAVPIAPPPAPTPHATTAPASTPPAQPRPPPPPVARTPPPAPTGRPPPPMHPAPRRWSSGREPELDTMSPNGRDVFQGRGRRGGRRGGSDRGRGGGGGGGGRGRSNTAGPPPAVLEAVNRLFTGEVSQGADQPMWRYIDPEGNMQGPFPASSMLRWFEEGYLADPELLMCGTERKVSPPNLPTAKYFVQFGRLLGWIRARNKFTPVLAEDIKGDRVPDFVVKLQKDTKETPQKNAPAGPSTAADDSLQDDTHKLAEDMVNLAIEKSLTSLGGTPEA